MEEKSYELSNHLGNVHITLSDYRRKEEDGLGVAYYSQVKSASDYYPFGQLLTEGNYSAEDYRFGFQGQEMDNEIKGTGNSINFKYRMHDARIGRFFAVDPLTRKYPYWTPYAFSGNRVIDMVELEGKEPAEPGEEDEMKTAERDGSDQLHLWKWNGEEWSDQGGSTKTNEVGPYTSKDIQKRNELIDRGGAIARGIFSSEADGEYPQIYGRLNISHTTPPTFWPFDGGGMELTLVGGVGGAISVDKIRTPGDNRNDTYLSISYRAGLEISAEARALEYHNRNGDPLTSNDITGASLSYSLSGEGFSVGGGATIDIDKERMRIHSKTGYKTIGPSFGTPGASAGLTLTFNLSRLGL